MKLLSHAGWIVRWLALALAMGLTLIAATHYSNPGFVVAAAAHQPAMMRALLDPNFWFGLLSLAGYSSALWCTGAIFEALRDRQPFEPRALRALTLTGVCLMAGAMAGLVKFSLAYNDVKNTVGFTAGFTLDEHTIPIAVIGGVFCVIAHQGRRLKAELEQFV